MIDAGGLRTGTSVDNWGLGLQTGTSVDDWDLGLQTETSVDDWDLGLQTGSSESMNYFHSSSTTYVPLLSAPHLTPPPPYNFHVLQHSTAPQLIHGPRPSPCSSSSPSIPSPARFSTLNFQVLFPFVNSVNYSTQWPLI